VAVIDVVACHLGPFCSLLFGNIGLILIHIGLLEGGIALWRIHGCGDSVSLPMVLTISENLLVCLYLINIVILELFGHLTPSFWSLASCVEPPPD
jgi:hypothetical protein